MSDFLLGWAAFGGPAMFLLVWAVMASEHAASDATQAPKRVGPQERRVVGSDGLPRVYRTPAWWEGWGWTAEQADRCARTLADEFVEGPDEPAPRSKPYR